MRLTGDSGWVPALPNLQQSGQLTAATRQGVTGQRGSRGVALLQSTGRSDLGVRWAAGVAMRMDASLVAIAPARAGTVSRANATVSVVLAFRNSGFSLSWVRYRGNAIAGTCFAVRAAGTRRSRHSTLGSDPAQGVPQQSTGVILSRCSSGCASRPCRAFPCAGITSGRRCAPRQAGHRRTHRLIRRAGHRCSRPRSRTSP